MTTLGKAVLVLGIVALAAYFVIQLFTSMAHSW